MKAHPMKAHCSSVGVIEGINAVEVEREEVRCPRCGLAAELRPCWLCQSPARRWSWSAGTARIARWWLAKARKETRLEPASMELVSTLRCTVCNGRGHMVHCPTCLSRQARTAQGQTAHQALRRDQVADQLAP